MRGKKVVIAKEDELKPKRKYKEFDSKKKKDASDEETSPSEDEEVVRKVSRKKNNGTAVVAIRAHQHDSDPEMEHREPSAEDKLV